MATEKERLTWDFISRSLMMNITSIINGPDSLLGFRFLFYSSSQASPFSSPPTWNLLPYPFLLLFPLPLCNTVSQFPEPTKKNYNNNYTMLLGKRPRPPMKRTTSMSEITFDLNTTLDDAQNNPVKGGLGPDPWSKHTPVVGSNGLDQSRVWALVSPRNHRRHSEDSAHTPEFLRVCFLCKHRLVPGRDIYMYR